MTTNQETSGDDATDDEPFEHVKRPPLPWRESNRTECGLPVAGNTVIDKPALVAKVKRLGQKRASFSTCMTCLDTCIRYHQRAGDIDEKALLNIVEREIQTARQVFYRDRRVHDTLLGDLQAIGILVERHRAEFDEIRCAQVEIPSLEEERRKREPKRRIGKKGGR
jgi:hypothetical protein